MMKKIVMMMMMKMTMLVIITVIEMIDTVTTLALVTKGRLRQRPGAARRPRHLIFII